MEVNVIDAFVRPGYRFKDAATILESGASYDEAVEFFRARAVQSEVYEVVLIEVQSALPVLSPAYDRGATEDELRARWDRHFQSLRTGKVDAPTDA